MIIYYIIFILSFMFCFCDFLPKKSERGIAYFLLTTFITLIVSFRGVGLDNDSDAYFDMFELYNGVTWGEIWVGGYGFVERGYVILNKIIANSGANFRVLLIAVALLTSIFNYIFFFKNTKFPFLAVLFYISFFLLYRDFTQIRYGLCAAICFWVLHFCLERKYWISMILLLIATSFHNSAIILPFAWVVVSIFRHKLWYIILTVPCLVLGQMISMTGLLSLFGVEVGHMEIYLKDASKGSLSISLVGLVVLIIYYFLRTYENKLGIIYNDVLNKHVEVYYRIVGLGVCLNFLFVNISIFQRFSFILFQFIIILFSHIAYKLYVLSESKGYFLIFYLTISSFLLFYGVRMINEALVRPYVFSL